MTRYKLSFFASLRRVVRLFQSSVLWYPLSLTSMSLRLVYSACRLLGLCIGGCCPSILPLYAIIPPPPTSVLVSLLLAPAVKFLDHAARKSPKEGWIRKGALRQLSMQTLM